MKCDKCIHKPVCKFRLETTASVLDRLENCCCYVEVDDPDDFIIKGDIDSLATLPTLKAVKVEYTHVVYTPDIQVKAIPIKSKTLCEKCVYDNCDDIYRTCDLCGVLTENNKCACVITENGEPCRHFKRKEGADI